jgi:hypothetical protein
VSEEDDRRRHPRFDVRLEGVLDGYRVFETLKLSVGGMLIRLPGDIALDQRVSVALELGDHVFRAPARVVFLGPDNGSEGTPDGNRVALAFDAPAPADDAALQRYIARELLASGGG